ncbi:MAG: YaiI/YqxD family protein [Phenylobacterium sp.]|uniref:YaiI/YqxD family protein n=1 Tax=Phenylobacterium sp. TaxID=1871053 RepID=UPI00391D85DB
MELTTVKPTKIYVDADACPVKDEVYRVAMRYGLKVFVVANSVMSVPQTPLVERVIVDAGPDAADDWIAERVAPGDVAITADIPLADRVLKAGAQALAPTGKPFTRDSIGMALAQRSILEQLRSTGEALGGPKPFDRNDRSRFLQALDAAIQRVRRGRP